MAGPAKNNSVALSSSSRSQKRSLDSLSIFQKLAVIPILIKALTLTLTTFLRDLLRNRRIRAATLYRHIQYTKVRSVTDNFSCEQMHIISPPTDKAYAKVCKDRGVAPQTFYLEDGTSAHWIGSPDASKILINFHGGGFVLPASEFMVDFMFRLQAAVSTKEKSFAIIFATYDLAPAATYPRQLVQGIELLRHVVGPLGKSPENLFLSGDSAGGNLVLGILSHISHPHPSSIPDLQLTAPLAGVVLVSPWVSMDHTPDSFTRNAKRDYISIRTGLKWAQAFAGTAEEDFYSVALTAPLEWWTDVKVEEFLVLAGKDEVLVDGITEFAGKLGKVVGKEKVQLFVGEDEAHDMPSLDLQFGFTEPGPQAREFEKFLKARI